MSSPKVLVIDIETAPLVAYTWGLFDQDVGLNQIQKDWHVLSVAAKWFKKPGMFYADQRHRADKSDDRALVQKAWELLDEADILITQNGKSFDAKKLNARFVYHGFKPPSPYRHIDTLRIAKKHFAFTSNKLAYLSDKLCTKYKKLTDHKFQGFDLWKECLAGNMSAWREMERYNKHDVLSLEELATKLMAWDSSLNFSVYREDETPQCSCGDTRLHARGFAYTMTGKFQRYQCQTCGRWTRGAKNLITPTKQRGIA